MAESEAQQQYIQNCIINEEQINTQFWKQLTHVHSVILVTDDSINRDTLSYSKLTCLHNADIKPDFLIEELPFDNVNGFDVPKEHDHNGYLTKLLIYCYQVLLYCYLQINMNMYSFFVVFMFSL